MIISKEEIEQLSSDVRKIIDGQALDLRNNREGRLSVLKNDIHTLANRLNEQADTLTQEKKALADALADISHQLKTPLASMMVMADLLENAPPEKQTEFVSNLKATLNHADWLVSSILKMAKFESGAMELNITDVGLTELIELAVEPLKILLEIKNQRVDFAGDGEMEAPNPDNSEDGEVKERKIHCDRRWTAEALTNIIKNASENSPEGSTITIESGENPICSFISITDAGDGIKQSDIPNLFRRFETSGKKKGFGIGLPLALTIMKEQNGDIEVDGGDNKGATFTLKFFK